LALEKQPHQASQIFSSGRADLANKETRHWQQVLEAAQERHISTRRSGRPRFAIIGASDDPQRISGRSLHYLKLAGYSGANLSHQSTGVKTVQGLKGVCVAR